MELGHLRYRKATYEEYLGRVGLKRLEQEALLAPKSSIASWYIVANKDRTVQTATLRREPDGRDHS
jgi:hypothetical protein